MFKLTENNFHQYVYNGLKNNYRSEEEYLSLLKHIVYIKRLLKKYKNNSLNVNLNLLINHFIIIYNEIDIKIATHILFFEISEIFYPQIKTILLFLNKINNEEIFIINNLKINISEIMIDEILFKLLNQTIYK